MLLLAVGGGSTAASVKLRISLASRRRGALARKVVRFSSCSLCSASCFCTSFRTVVSHSSKKVFLELIRGTYKPPAGAERRLARWLAHD